MINKKLINVGAEAACLTDSLNVFGAEDSYSSNVAVYRFESNANDETGNYNGTATNVTYSTGNFGNAAEFNGSSSAIVVPNNILTTNDHSVSMWFNLDDTNGIQTVVEFDYENRILFRAVSTDSNLAYVGNSGYFNHGITFSAGQWYHLVITFSAGNPFKIYVDGVLSYTGGNTNILAQNNDNIIGASNSSGANGVDGKIDQVRFFTKELSASEVETLYNETVATTTDTNLLGDSSAAALYTLDYDASDAGGQYDGTPTNVEFGVGGQINYGARFNGSSSYIDAGQINFGANNVSVSLWVYPNSSQNAYANIIDYNHSSSGGWTIQQDNTSTNSYKVTVYDGSSYNVSSAFSLTANQWNHVVFTVTSAGAYNIYVDNGTPTTGTGLTGLSTSTNNNLNIGRWYSGTSRYWGGSIDQVRIFSKVLNSTEVSTLYAETACEYTCTTDTVNHPTTNVAYYKLDNDATDEVGSYDGTENNISYTFGRFGQAAVFNGSSSYIDLGNNSSNNGSLISVSCWFRTTSTSQGIIWNNGGQDSQSTGLCLSVQASGVLYFQANTTTTFVNDTGTTTVNDGNWHHVVANYDNGDFNVYLDGNSTPELTGTSTAFTTTANQNFLIGRLSRVSSAPFNGDIDQVRIFSSALDSTQVTQLYEEKPCADTSTFKTVLYEGNSSTQYISNVGFSPDLVWIKRRTTATTDHVLMDTIREQYLISNKQNAQASYGSVFGFNHLGFDLNGSSSSYNLSGNDYVAWCWKAGGDAVAGTGTNVSNVSISANQEAGFSIVKYTGGLTSATTSTGASVQHGLGAPPDLIISKALAGTHVWSVRSTALDDMADTLWLHDTREVITSYRTSNPIAASTNDVMYLNWLNSVNVSGQEVIAYCFRSVSGVSKVGKYTGNGTTSKVVSEPSFEPSFVMIKRTDSTSNWRLFDNKRGTDLELYANSNAIDASATGYINFNSNGFEITTSGGWLNEINGTYIYLAFA